MAYFYENFDKPLTKDRLSGWNNSLFLYGFSGLYRVLAGRWRDNSSGPMQVVSGAMGKEKVHFQAPEASGLDKEMQRFLEWVKHNTQLDLVLKAGSILPRCKNTRQIKNQAK